MSFSHILLFIVSAANRTIPFLMLYLIYRRKCPFYIDEGTRQNDAQSPAQAAPVALYRVDWHMMSR